MTADTSTHMRTTSTTTRTSAISSRVATFWTLVSAQTISLLYQVYRSTIMEAPQWDAFDAPAVIGYTILFGVALLARLGRRWTWWLTLLSSIAIINVGIFFYFPEVTAARQFGPIDWIEGVVYEGLLFVAAIMSIFSLAGRTLAPDTKPA